jgi:hypothetical protein
LQDLTGEKMVDHLIDQSTQSYFRCQPGKQLCTAESAVLTLLCCCEVWLPIVLGIHPLPGDILCVHMQVG